MPYTKKKVSKWIKDLNVRLDTTKLPEESIGRTQQYFWGDPSPESVSSSVTADSLRSH